MSKKHFDEQHGHLEGVSAQLKTDPPKPGQAKARKRKATPASELEHEPPAQPAEVSEQEEAGAAADEPVGYRRPPKSTRFKKGQSGNPKGRPRKSKPHPGNLRRKAGRHVLDELAKIMTGEVRLQAVSTTDTGAQILAKAMFNDAARRDGRTRQFLLTFFCEWALAGDDRYLPKDRGNLEADIMARQARLLMAPKLSDEELEQELEEMDAIMAALDADEEEDE